MILAARYGTRDVARAAAFYDAVLGAIGAERYLQQATVVGYQTPGQTGIFLVHLAERHAIIESPSTQISFAARDAAEVDEAYSRVAGAGGVCGAPPTKSGVGNMGYYIAYAADPDGNRLALYFAG